MRASPKADLPAKPKNLASFCFKFILISICKTIFILQCFSLRKRYEGRVNTSQTGYICISNKKISLKTISFMQIFYSIYCKTPITPPPLPFMKIPGSATGLECVASHLSSQKMKRKSLLYDICSRCQWGLQFLIFPNIYL